MSTAEAIAAVVFSDLSISAISFARAEALRVIVPEYVEDLHHGLYLGRRRNPPEIVLLSSSDDDDDDDLSSSSSDDAAAEVDDHHSSGFGSEEGDEE